MGETAVASPRRFILQALDPATGCPILEAMLRLDDLAGLRNLIGRDADDDPDIEQIYKFATEDLPALWAFAGFAFPQGIGTIRLQAWHPLRNVPYLVHTGFELALMLEGRKPLSAFSGTCPSQWLDDYLMPFGRYVSEGRILRRVVDRVSPARPRKNLRELRLRHIFFALPGEEWRVDSYLAMLDAMAETGWTEVLERRQGELLGYLDWQRDWWETQRKGALTRRR